MSREREKVLKVVKVKECESERVTFEHRHENKSCSACRERVNESVKVLKVFLVPSFLSDVQTFVKTG